MCVFQDALAQGGDAREGAAVAHEQVESQLLLEKFQLSTQCRLRGTELRAGRRNVETTLRDRDQKAQLLKRHCCPADLFLAATVVCRRLRRLMAKAGLAMSDRYVTVALQPQTTHRKLRRMNRHC